MKNLFKMLLCIVALISMQSFASAQIAYSITDNNRDVSGLQQQYYQFDLSSGQGTFISNLTIGGQTIRREYEGLASSGSVTFGVAEFDTELCNTGSDPIIGLSSDVRIFRPAGTYPLANGVASPIGPQIGETCFPAGFTEAAAGYNQLDGFIYAIASDDLLPANAPRSRIFRVSPTTGLATQIGAAAGITLTAGSGGDENPYFDGLTVLPNGQAFGTEARFTNNPTQSTDPNVADNGGLYRIFLTGPNAGRATFVKYLLNTDANRDTGLANTQDGVLYLLLEDARVWTTTAESGTAVTPAVFSAGNPAGSNTLSTPGCLRTTPFCGDFEGFDIPAPALR
ncbi:MAG: hypothetical protein LH472_03355 [Pyrinomonadaceae bacterium]|nr:hypothetical protein [Pyrinomonadaceae bacterium]